MQEEKIDLMMQLTRVEWLLHKYHQQNHMHFGPFSNPRKGQGRILSILKMKPEISQKDLSYLLEMRPQSLGELLSKLEMKGYITRTISETDRRVMNIKLTKEGEEATISTEQEFSFDKIFECLKEEEQQNFSNYLSRIIHTLELQIEEDGPEKEFEHGFHGGHHFGHPMGHPPIGREERGPHHGRGFHRGKGPEHNRGFGPHRGCEFDFSGQFHKGEPHGEEKQEAHMDKYSDMEQESNQEQLGKDEV